MWAALARNLRAASYIYPRRFHMNFPLLYDNNIILYGCDGIVFCIFVPRKKEIELLRPVKIII